MGVGIIAPFGPVAGRNFAVSINTINAMSHQSNQSDQSVNNMSMQSDQSPQSPQSAAAPEGDVQPAAADAPASPASPEVAAHPDTGRELGFLELLRAPGDGETQLPSATDRVLSRPRHSAWDY